MKEIFKKMKKPSLLAALLLVPSLASAQELDSGDTAWMIMATVLVLFMTIPGLSLFYAGMVRSKNVLSVMCQCFAITALMSIIWVVYAYSFAFGTSDGGFFGGFEYVFLKHMTVDLVNGSIPESVWVTFQMTFAIITPALIVGAFAERMKFSAMLWFMAIWVSIVYAPICHWVWGGGWLSEQFNIIDFAGGTVVHINAGIAGLVIAIVLGKREGYPKVAMPPHNLTLTVIGAAMLWVGWFGFNAGSQLAADGTAGMAMLVTQIATAVAVLTWMFAEWITHGKPSALGLASGAVAGLVAITPASGSVGVMGALAIGLFAGVGCFYAATRLKRVFGYDDTLDVFGVHCVGGIIGAMLTGVFSAVALGGTEDIVISTQVFNQGVGVVVTLVYSGGLSFVILKIIDAVIGLRVTVDEEQEGLDLASHDERGYVI